MKTQIVLGKTSVASVQNNAGVFYGESTFQSWRTYFKGNGAVTRISGDGNLILSRLNSINDQDFIDLRYLEIKQAILK